MTGGVGYRNSCLSKVNTSIDFFIQAIDTNDYERERIDLKNGFGNFVKWYENH
jgi:hypothetical protein